MMPGRVDTMAGYMYYLCDSGMTGDFGGDGGSGGCGWLGMGYRKRDRLVCDRGRRYVMGEIVGVGGENVRVGVDYCGGRGQDCCAGI